MKSSLLSTAALGIALSLSAASASALNIGGITVTPGNHLEIAGIYENMVSNVGDVLTGYGEIAQVNGANNFCSLAPFCELTFVFGGFVVNQVVESAPGVPSNYIFSGGWVNFYVGSDATKDFNPLTSSGQAQDIAEASDGTLWLTLAGHEQTWEGYTGSLFSTITAFGTNLLSGSGTGFLDVDLTGSANGNTAGAGALANSNFDTDGMLDLHGSPVDFLLESTFSTKNSPAHGETPLSGSADLRGVAIPEPGTLTLLGLGLLGLGAFSRRKAKA